jgi:superfamily II DNA or RNA helicase
MAQSPEDLGFDGSRFKLLPLNVQMVKTENAAPVDGGDLFGVSQLSATDMHRVKRQTAEGRARAAAELVLSEASEPWVIWCDTDYEADAIMAALKGVSGVVEVRGSFSADKKEESLEAFADGSARILVTKPSVCGFGLNWQHCARTVFVGRSFSYEAWYQAVRRFWRFGQSREVLCFVVVAEGEDAIGRVIDRKADDHSSMKTAMAKAMRRASQVAQVKAPYDPTHIAGVPSWLKSVV